MQTRHINLLSFLLFFSATITNAGKYVHKHVLNNGLTILVRPVKTAQKVSTQLWFNVGSKHEADDEKGLAHWLEHMCFKGTEKMSETDIRLTTAKLSGVFNATTNYDWTRFYLNFPAQHWFEALPILSDIMRNCTFKQDLLNAEVQVVIQEMKNNRDNFTRALFIQMLSAMFPDHPYLYPVIGFKSDLESLTRDKLAAFYQKHYVPNNAVLVVVGNVKVKDVIKRAEAAFGSLAADWSYTSKQFTTADDICSKNIVLYRDVQKPLAMAAFKIPGAKTGQGIAYDVLLRIVAGGRDSRLYRRLVDQEQLANSIGVQKFSLFDADLLLFIFEPRTVESIPTILNIMKDEFNYLKTHGPKDQEIEWAVQKLQSGFFDLLESNHDQAEVIAEGYLATGNEEYAFEYLHNDYKKIKQEVTNLARSYLRSSVMSTGILLPLEEEERAVWAKLQEQSNKEDAQLLQDKKRQSPVEPGKYMHSVTAREPNVQDVPVPKELMLKNGLKVLYYQNDNVPKVVIQIHFKFDEWYEPKESAGLCSILNAMLLEGTKKRSKKNLMEEFEKYGVGVGTGIGSLNMSVLSYNCGPCLELATDVITSPAFEEESLDKIKQHALSNYKRFWDTPQAILNHLIDQHIWQGKCPNTLGTPKTIASISPEMLHNFHQKHYSPQGATVVIVGDLRGIPLHQLLEETLGTWHGPVVEDSPFEHPNPDVQKTITHHIEREQVVLCVCGLSVDRFHKDFYALNLFNQTLNKKLFSLREQTNAFYHISGSVLGNTTRRPGVAFIETQVSQTRADEAERMILAIIDNIADTFDEHDLIEAQNKIINSLSDLYSTNGSIANAFTVLDEYELPFNYFVTRIEKIKNITVEEVREAVKKVFNTKNMCVYKVGPLH